MNFTPPVSRREIPASNDHASPGKSSGSCAVCGHGGPHAVLVAHEMMFGFRDEFTYFECAACGCLQLAEIPADLDRYYPPEYFPDPDQLPRENPIPPFLRRQRTAHLLGRFSFFGRRATERYGRPTVPIFGQPDYFTWLNYCCVHLRSRILDVGCGRGILLRRLEEDGFKDLTGIDPYLTEEVHRPGFRLLKTELYALQETFDLIMLHHTFEHMAEPHRVFAALERLLRRGRYAVIRIPVAGSYAHRRYGTNWVQLDAPRHLFLHTPRSIAILAAHAGLELHHTTFDSDGFQLWASEQYVKGIPLRDPRSLNMHPAERPFSDEQLAEFNAHAVRLNAAGEGDSACFYLFKPARPRTRRSEVNHE
jgi:SAM-dependent methyltransferase